MGTKVIYLLFHASNRCLVAYTDANKAQRRPYYMNIEYQTLLLVVSLCKLGFFPQVQSVRIVKMAADLLTM